MDGWLDETWLHPKQDEQRWDGSLQPQEFTTDAPFTVTFSPAQLLA